MRNSSGVPQGKIKWRRMGLGAGGWLRAGVSISNAGDIMVGGDTNGVWIRPNGSNLFTDLLNTTTLPVGSDLYGSSFVDHTIDGSAGGCQFMALSPSNGNVGIFGANCSIYKSSNLLSASPTVTALGGPYPSDHFCSNKSADFMWRKAVFDPQNANVFLIGTQSNVLYYSTDGSTLNTLTVDTPGTYIDLPGYHLVACDPSSTVSGGIKQIWYYSTYGVGVKRSTTGPGGPYTLVSGSPTNVRSLKVDAAGNVYALNAHESTGGNLYKATQTGTFSKNTGTGLPTNEYADVAINPQNANQIVMICIDNFEFTQSWDGGATWGGAGGFWGSGWPTPNGTAMTAQQVGWMQPHDSHGKSQPGTTYNFGTSGGNIEFHPTNGTLYMASGVGLFKSTPPTHWAQNDPTATWWWLEDTAGVEQLFVNDVYTPAGGSPICSCGDVGILKTYDLGYKKTQSTIPNATPDQTAWSIEGCPGNPSFLTCCVGYWNNCCSYSTDAGENWTPFTGNFPLAGSIVYGGGVILPRTTTNFFGFFDANLRPCSTTDGGATWGYEDVNMPGMKITSRAYFGSGDGLLIVDSKTAWDTTQTYTIILNAASGAGSVSVSGTTITITPAATGASASAIASQINASSANTMVQASFGGLGTSSPGTGSQNLSFTSGWGWVPNGFIQVTRNACIDKTNGDIYAYNYGDGGPLGASAPWAGIWKRDHTSGTWSKVAGLPGNIVSSTQNKLRDVLGQTGHMTYNGPGTALYHTTNGWQTSSQVGDGTNFFTNMVGAHAGAAAPGQTYPAVYVCGTLNGVPGYYGCFDGSWTNWKLLSDPYPAGLIYGTSTFFAHPDTFGRIDAGSLGGFIGLYDCSLTVS